MSVEIWIDGYDYRMELGADGQKWLHCPKQNRREKSWLTSEEVARHFHAMTMLEDKWKAQEEAHQQQEREKEEAHQQHLREIEEYERKQQEKREKWEKQQQQKGKGKKKNKEKEYWVKKDAQPDQDEENDWEQDGGGWEEPTPATRYMDEKEKKSDKPSRPNTPPGLLDSDKESASAKMSTGSNKTTWSSPDYQEKVEFMGCKTWPEFRRLAAAEAEKEGNEWEGRKVCYVCPAKGCQWSSKRMNWSSAEYALSAHVSQQGINEEAYWQKPRPSLEDLASVVHPGRKWMTQVSPKEESEEELMKRLKAQGIVCDKRMKKQEDETRWASGSFEDWEAQWEKIEEEQQGRPSGAASSTDSWVKPQRKPGSKGSGKSNKGPKQPKEPPAHKKQKMKDEWSDRVSSWWKDWDRNRRRPHRR